MLQASTVVTAQRFEQGLCFSDFLAQAVVNRDQFEQYYRDSPLSAEDLAFFRKAASLPNGPAKILVLAEAWCSDVYRELPTAARIAEAAGMDLRIFLRDQNPDIMDEFLSNEGKSRSIPVLVFYTKDTHYITHFTERSAAAHAEIASITNQVASEMNLPPGTTFRTVAEGSRQAFIRNVIAKITPRFPDWRKQSVAEMRSLLSKALHISGGAH